MKRGAAIENHIQKSELLTAVFTLCLLDKALAGDLFDNLITKAKQDAAVRVALLNPPPKISFSYDALGLIVYRWQRSAKYLDDEGNPLKIPARGKAPSIEALFREVKRKDYFSDGFRHLRQLGRIRRTKDGLYLPANEVTIIRDLRPEMVEVVVQTIYRLVATVLHNTSFKSKNAIRLVERTTSVPDLPESEMLAFKLFAREQGGALINTMNEWLERRRGDGKARRKSSGQLTAGLHVFSFVEKESR
jgi:hypothetical protein